jgi:hypothetical protein
LMTDVIPVQIVLLPDAYKRRRREKYKSKLLLALS